MCFQHQHSISEAVKEFAIIPLHNNDQIVYEVCGDGLLCVVGLNHKANWDDDRDIINYLVYEIARAIDIKENE